MKIISAILILGIISFKPIEEGNAKVQSVQGVKIYLYSEPTQAFTIIDRGSVKVTLTGGCEEQIKQAANKAAKMKANGVIIELGTPTRWTAILLKE